MPEVDNAGLPPRIELVHVGEGPSLIYNLTTDDDRVGAGLAQRRSAGLVEGLGTPFWCDGRQLQDLELIPPFHNLILTGGSAPESGRVIDRRVLLLIDVSDG